MSDNAEYSDHDADPPSEVRAYAVQGDKKKAGKNEPVTVNRDKFKIAVMSVDSPDAENDPNKPSHA